MSEQSSNEKASPELLEKLASASAKKHNQEAQDKLESAISKLIIFKPIFGLVFMYLNKRQVHEIPTMGVGIINRVSLGLFYNPDFVLSLTPTELRAVLQHESLHILLHHIVRSAHFDYNKKGYNYAADLAINCHIAGLPDRENIKPLYPKNFNLPEFESSEWYYEKLKQEAEKNGPGQGGLDWSNGRGNLVDDHEGWKDCEEDIIKEKIKDIAEKGIKAQEQKGWSDIGTALAKAIIDANKPSVDWKREVRYFINRIVQMGRKTTRTRLNRREQSSKKFRSGMLKDVYIQPGNKRDYTSKILVALDTSGSVSDLEIAAFIGEINGMCNHVEVHVTMFDTKILIEPPIPIAKKISKMDVIGRGGTDFGPIIEYVDQHYYDGLIILTDGCAPFPTKPKARVLWGITPPGDSITPPYGKRVRIEIKPE